MAEQPQTPAAVPMPPQTIKAVVMPLDLFNRVHDALREAPHRHVDHVLKECATLQVNDVNIGPRG